MEVGTLGTWLDGLRPVIRLVSRILLLGLAVGGAFGGYVGGEQLAPRNDTVIFGCAAGGIVLAVLIWLPIDIFLRKLVAKPDA